MKRSGLFLLFTIYSMTVFCQKQPVETTNGYRIDIKTSAICEMCKEAIEKDLTFEKGVKNVNLNLENKVVSVVYNEKKTNPDIIRKRITQVGYHADNMSRDSEAYENLPFCCKDGAHGSKPYEFENQR